MRKFIAKRIQKTELRKQESEVRRQEGKECYSFEFLGLSFELVDVAYSKVVRGELKS